jgi:hypothetical protein
MSIDDPDTWTVYGIPTFITKHVEPGTVVAFSMIYEPTEPREDRWRISAVKVTGIDAPLRAVNKETG